VPFREDARVVAADIAADRLEQLAGELPDLDLVPVATNIEAPFNSEHAAGVLGPIMQATIPRWPPPSSSPPPSAGC
jgi:hypothetical protein